MGNKGFWDFDVDIGKFYDKTTDSMFDINHDGKLDLDEQYEEEQYMKDYFKQEEDKAGFSQTDYFSDNNVPYENSTSSSNNGYTPYSGFSNRSSKKDEKKEYNPYSKENLPLTYLLLFIGYGLLFLFFYCVFKFKGII